MGELVENFGGAVVAAVFVVLAIAPACWILFVVIRHGVASGIRLAARRGDLCTTATGPAPVKPAPTGPAPTTHAAPRAQAPAPSRAPARRDDYDPRPGVYEVAGVPDGGGPERIITVEAEDARWAKVKGERAGLKVSGVRWIGERRQA